MTMNAELIFSHELLTQGKPNTTTQLIQAFLKSCPRKRTPKAATLTSVTKGKKTEMNTRRYWCAGRCCCTATQQRSTPAGNGCHVTPNGSWAQRQDPDAMHDWNAIAQALTIYTPTECCLVMPFYRDHRQIGKIGKWRRRTLFSDWLHFPHFINAPRFFPSLFWSFATCHLSLSLSLPTFDHLICLHDCCRLLCNLNLSNLRLHE